MAATFTQTRMLVACGVVSIHTEVCQLSSHIRDVLLPRNVMYVLSFYLVSLRMCE